MEPTKPPRRHFLQQMGAVAGAAWLGAQWPAITAAAQHAHEAVKANLPTSFSALTPEQAVEVTAIAARIIPTDEDPGATEAGVVYFIDRALQTFSKDDKPAYDSGLRNVNLLTSKMFPSLSRFSLATAEQQDQVLAELSKEPAPSAPGIQRSPAGGANNFFPIIWGHTLMGFLADPEAGGNRDYVGWKLIGRDPAHSFSPPYGEYDKNYPGWQAASLAETEKK